jgi:hypothetical protein
VKEALVTNLRTAIVALLVSSLCTPVAAGDLGQAAAAAVRDQAAPQVEPAAGGGGRTATWLGTGLFVTGMTVGLVAFISNKNGKYTEQGEANAVNKKLGAAGVGAAFAGGVLLFLGTRKSTRSSSLTIGPDRVTFAKHLSW